MQEPNISDYYCYRKYLGDFFDYKKIVNPNYSYRVFASQAGIKSSGHLKMIVNRDRNLGPKTLPMYLKALKFKKKKEESLFQLLVKYDHTQSIDEKTELFEKILGEKSKNTSNPLERNQYELLSQWYVVATYVLVGMNKFHATVESIYEQLSNKVPRIKIEKAITILIEMDLIKPEHGRYVQSGGSFSTPDEIKAVAVNKYHENMVNLSLDSLKTHSVDERNFNGATIAVGPKNYKLLCKKLNEFRKEVNEMIGNDEEATQVYQLCVNLFPLTKGIE
jgi:uncharacterized protein (TIGR02147 family)